MAATKKIELMFDDYEIGCEEYGYIGRRLDPDDEDRDYQRYVSKLTKKRVRVIDAVLYIYEE